MTKSMFGESTPNSGNILKKNRARVSRLAKCFITNIDLGYSGQESDFNSAGLKITIKTV